MKLNILMVVLVATFCVGSTVVAADPNAPSWRGTTGSTFQEWKFNTSSNPIVPEVLTNLFGTPKAVIDYEPPFGTGWKDIYPVVYGSAQGWWDICRGSVTLSVINHPTTGCDTSKDMQVQVVYWDDLSDAPNVSVTPSATLISKTSTLVEHVVNMGDWRMDLWIFHVTPNQNSEVITVAGHPTMGSQIDRIAVDTRYSAIAASAAQARSLPDGTVCELTGPIVTRSFDTFFYFEDTSRAAGIRVNCASGQAVPGESTAPKVSGVIRTISGERVIDQASVTPGGSGSVLPLGMNNRAVASTLSPQAMLITLWGRAVVPSPTGYSFSLNDGSGTPVRVELHGTAAPVNGTYVAVTGVLGADASGPVLRVGQTDLARQMN